jgi:hypothetical protein
MRRDVTVPLLRTIVVVIPAHDEADRSPADLHERRGA